MAYDPNNLLELARQGQSSAAGTVETSGLSPEVADLQARFNSRILAEASDELSIRERMRLGFDQSLLGQATSWADARVYEWLGRQVEKGNRPNAPFLDSILADVLGTVQSGWINPEDTRALSNTLAQRAEAQTFAENTLGIEPGWGTLAKRVLIPAATGLGFDIPAYFNPVGAGLRSVGFLAKMAQSRPLLKAMTEAGAIFGSYDVLKEGFRQANTGQYDPLQIVKRGVQGAATGAALGGVGYRALTRGTGNIVRTGQEAALFTAGAPAMEWALGDRPSPIFTREDLVGGLGLSIGFGIWRRFGMDPTGRQRFEKEILEAGGRGESVLTADQLRLVNEIQENHFRSLTNMSLAEYRNLRQPNEEQMVAFREAELARNSAIEKIRTGQITTEMVDDTAVTEANRAVTEQNRAMQEGYETLRRFADEQALEGLRIIPEDYVLRDDKVPYVRVGESPIHPRGPRARGMGFVSPFDENISLTPKEALDRISTDRHQRTVSLFDYVDRIIKPGPAPLFTRRNAIGEWIYEGQAYGENSAITRYNLAIEWEDLIAATAAKGFIGNQLSVGVFRSEKGGADVVWEIPTAGKTLEEVAQALDQAGIEGRTIELNDRGEPISALVMDLGATNRQAVYNAHRSIGVGELGVLTGRGKFLDAGENATREQAREYFKRLVGESRFPDLIERAYAREKADRVRSAERHPAEVVRGPGGIPLGPRPARAAEALTEAGVTESKTPYEQSGFEQLKLSLGLGEKEPLLPEEKARDPLYYLRPENQAELKRLESESARIAVQEMGTWRKLAGTLRYGYRNIRTGRKEFGGARILAGALARDLQTKGRIKYEGYKVSSPFAAAILAQPLRSGKFETFSYFVTDLAGNVLGNRAYTSKHPAAAMPMPMTARQRIQHQRLTMTNPKAARRYMQDLEKRELLSLYRWLGRIAEKNGISEDDIRIIAAHNHPAGFAQPSTADVKNHSMLQRLFGDRYAYAIVVNHGHYAAIRNIPGTEEVTINLYSMDPKITESGDLRAMPVMGHEVLSTRIHGPETAWEVAGHFNPDQVVTAVFLNSNGYVSGVASIPNKLISQVPYATSRGLNKLLDMEPAIVQTMRGLSRAFGSDRAIAVYDGPDAGVIAALPAMVQRGVFLDAVIPNEGGWPWEAVGTSARTAPGLTGSLMGMTSYRVGEQKSVYKSEPPEMKGLTRVKISEGIVGAREMPKDAQAYWAKDREVMVKLKDLAVRFARYKDWYRDGRPTAEALLGPDTDTFLGIFAAINKSASVRTAASMAVKAYDQFLRQREQGIPASKMVFGKDYAKAVGEATEAGQKKYGLYRATEEVTRFINTGRLDTAKLGPFVSWMLSPQAAQMPRPTVRAGQGRDPGATGQPLPIGTIVRGEYYQGGDLPAWQYSPQDLWMQRLYWGQHGPENKTPTDLQRRYMQDTQQRLAEELGWTEGEVQAALWASSMMRVRDVGKGKAELGGPKEFTSARVELLKHAHEILNLRLRDRQIEREDFPNYVDQANDLIANIPQHELVGTPPGAEPVPMQVELNGQAIQRHLKSGMVPARRASAAQRRSEEGIRQFAQSLAPEETGLVLRSSVDKYRRSGSDEDLNEITDAMRLRAEGIRENRGLDVEVVPAIKTKDGKIHVGRKGKDVYHETVRKRLGISMAEVEEQGFVDVNTAEWMTIDEAANREVARTTRRGVEYRAEETPYTAEAPGERPRDGTTPTRKIGGEVDREPGQERRRRARPRIKLGLEVDVPDTEPKFQYQIEQYGPDIRRHMEAMLEDPRFQRGLEVGRRGVLTDAMVGRLAERYGMTIDEYRRARQGFVGTAEAEAHVAALYEASMKALDQARSLALNAKTIEEKLRAEVMIEQQGQLAGMLLMRYFTSGSEHGRALGRRARGVFGASSDRLAQKAIKAIMDETKLSEQQQQLLIEKIVKSGGDRRKIFEAIQEGYLPTWWDKVMEVRTSFLLTSPVTYMRNVVGNTLALGSYMAEVATGVPIDMMYETTQRMLGKTPSPGRRHALEIWSDYTGMMLGFKEGTRLALRALRDEDFAYMHGRIGEEAVQVRHAIKGPAGRAVRYPFRILSAQDLFFSTILRSAEAYRLATRHVINQKLVGPARSRAIKELADQALQVEEHRIRELAATPEKATTIQEEVAAGAGARALEFTYRAPMGDVGQYFNRIRFSPSVGGKFARFLIPFYATPVNIAKFNFQRVPVLAQFVSPKNWADLKAGRTQGVDSLARMVVGGAAFGSVLMLALEGYITGSGPKDKSARKEWENAGNQQYSFRTPDWMPGDNQWRSYRGFSPVTEEMALAAEIVEDFMYNDTLPTEDKVLKAALSVARTTVDQPFMTSVADLLEAVRADEQYGERRLGSMAQNTAAGVAIPRGIAFLARALDPTMRTYPESVQERLSQEIPWERHHRLPFRDQLGRTYTSANSWLDAVIRTRSSEPRSVVDEWIFNLKVTPDDPVIRFPQRTVLGSRMSSEDYDTFLQIRREHLLPMLERAAKSPTGQSKDPGAVYVQREILIPRMVSAVDQIAREMVYPRAELHRLGLPESDENIRRVVRVLRNPILEDQYRHDTTSDEMKLRILATGRRIE